MSFIVTARKWRPQKFGDVVGQEHITTTLKNAIRSSRIAHAYLFTGPRGVGKTTTARILAKTLNCLNPRDAEPCNECEMCRTIQTSQLMDIIEIDGASNRGIDEVRTLRDSVKYAPTRGKYKVYIIDEVHMLTRESFNAFLKTLEEPPSHTIFIFATTDAHKVPATIISRCQRFDFRRIQLESIKSLLKQIAESEKIEIDDKTLTIIAKKADGALRDAESIFDQVVSFCGNSIDPDTVAKMLNLINDEVYFKISDAVLEKNFKTVFDVTNIIYENGWDFVDFTDGLIEHFRNILAAVITEKTELIETADVFRARYLQYIDKFTHSDLLRLLNFLLKTYQELKFSQNHKLKVEISLSHLIGLEKSATISQIISDLNSGTDSDLKAGGSSSFFLKDDNFKNLRAVNEPQKNYSYKTSEPEIKPLTDDKKLQDAAAAEFSFDFIVSKWEGFVKEIYEEKSLTVAPFIKASKPFRLEKNKLNLSLKQELSEQQRQMFSSYENYLLKKTEEYFGKRLFFQFNKEESSTINAVIQENSEPQLKKLKISSDPHINAIISELNGEEIS